MNVTFCGHSQLEEPEKIKVWLKKIIEDLIKQGAKTFYLGGYGQFDVMAASVLYKMKKQHCNIEIILVLAYPDKKYDASIYDSSIYPPLENIPRRYAILKRNEYMIDISDIVISYVKYNYGGAYTTLKYARRKNKQIILYYE